jgi:hypothetical protein
MKTYLTVITGMMLACSASYAQNTVWPSTSSIDNVGIGTTSPQSKLEVSSPTSNYASSGTFHLNGAQGWGHVVTLATDNNNGDDARLLFSYRNNSKRWALGGHFNSNRFSIWENAGNGIYGSDFGTERFTLSPGGNVGIGEANPKTLLDVQGPVLTGGGNGNIDPSNLFNGNINYLANSAQMLIGWNRLAGYGETDFIANQGGGVTGGFAFFNHNNNNAESLLMWIKGDGNVGIGTNNPQAKLAVNGLVRAREVKVESTNWPDYVFNPTYRLPALSVVKAYIIKNQHLPDMPSESEVVKEGVNLGEIVKLQTKKIEELTLYLLEQDKQMQAQKRVNLNLPNRLRILEGHQDKLSKLSSH